MTTPRARNGNLLAMRAEAGKQVDRIPASRFPVQHEIQHLQNELNAFNDRIIELENEGHRGHAMEVLKAKAIDFARQIDELRCLHCRTVSEKDGLESSQRRHHRFNALIGPSLSCTSRNERSRERGPLAVQLVAFDREGVDAANASATRETERPSLQRYGEQTGDAA